MIFTKLLLRLNFLRRKIPVFKLYKQLLNNQKLTFEEYEELQNEKLIDFVMHCYTTVPYYKELFDVNNIDPKTIQTKADLVKIPILTKDIVRNNTDRLISTECNKALLTRTNTSGSTGKPMSFYSGLNRRTHLTAGLWRVYSRSGWRPGENIAYLWGFQNGKNTKKTWLTNLKEKYSGATYLSAWKANGEDFKRWYTLIKKNKSTIIVCYASTGSRFAKWILDNKFNLPLIKGVFCTSEKLFDSQKEMISDAFNCDVYNLYGCGEVNHIACTCNQGNMHINPDMVIVELGEKNDSGVKPLLLTGFNNRAMPFLRYQNGDAGELLSNRCGCNINTPLMDLSVSRLSDVFTFSDGKKYPSLYFILRLYDEGFEGVELFQFYQNEIDHIYLYVVKNSKFNEYTHSKLLAVVEEVEAHVNHVAKVTLEYKEYIQQSISSKHYYAKSDIK